MEKFEKRPSIIPSMDVDIIKMETILCDLVGLNSEVGGIKIGSLLVWKHGLDKIVDVIKSTCNYPIIFDAQKAGTDIPSIVEEQVKIVSDAGIDAFIASPLGSGCKTLEAFINKSFDCDITPIVLLEMTHPMANSFLKYNAGEEILIKSLDMGVEYYVAPGNKANRIESYKKIAKQKNKIIKIFSPGLGAQGGDPINAVVAGTDYFIVGRSIYEADNPRREVIKAFEAISRFKP